MTALRAVNSSPMRDLLFFLPFWTNVISQPSILNTSISCDKTDFLLKIRFNETFAGAILTEKGDPNCVYVNGSIQKSTDYEVKIPLTGCETRRNSDGNLENEIIIQTGDRFNPRYDKKYLLTCIPTSPIFRDSQVTVSFGGITINTELTTAISLINSPKVDYRVVVRDGDSPDAPVLNRPLAVGDRVTYTVHLGPTSRGHIGRCWASDGKSNLELSDNSGCSLQKAGDVWGDFEEIRDDSGAMFLNHIKAWAFPTSNEVNIFCNLHICAHCRQASCRNRMRRIALNESSVTSMNRFTDPLSTSINTRDLSPPIPLQTTFRLKKNIMNTVIPKYEYLEQLSSCNFSILYLPTLIVLMKVI